MELNDFYDYEVDYSMLPETNDPLSIYTVETQKYTVEQNESKFCMHKHSYYELHYILEGEILYSFSEERSLKCSKGDWIIVPPQISHSLYRIKAGTIKNSCQFSVGTNEQLNDLLKAIVKDIPYVTGCITDEMLEIIERQKKLIKTKTLITAWLIRNDVLNLILKTVNIYMESINRVLPPVATAGKDEGIFYLALKFIKDNADHHISCEDVVNFSGVYKKRLNKIFHKYLGKTISVCIAEYRLEYAKIELKTNKEKTVREISDKLDFCNEYYFSRFFKKHTGKTPQQYRNL